MKITKTSELTGITRTLDLPVTEDQIQVWLDGMLIQAAMPNLDADQREFVKTGITPEEWENWKGKDMLFVTQDRAEEGD